MFQPNSVIAGRYQVIRLVGQGGMSNLYLAYDRKYNNAIVVVKEMTAAYSDPKEQQMAVELFHREAKLLASLNHRHIPKVYDYFQYAGKYYLSMEYIDGGDLAQKLEAAKGPLPENQVLEWGEQIATVLFYLHKHDPPIVFRDVKPSNIMLTDQGVKLIDFGIARHFDQAKKGDTMRIGSPGYAPPEQYAAQTDPRSDIYALGVTLHHALTGRDPTATQTPFLVPPARNLNPALQEATAAMLARATQLDPNDRYQSVLEMKNDIKAILSRGKQSTRVVGAPPPPPGPAVAPASSPAAVALNPSAAPTTAGAATPAASAPGAAASTPGAAASAPPAAVQTAVTTAPAGAGQPAAAVQTSATPKKKTRGKGWLMVAAVLLLLGGGAFAAGPALREQGVRKLQALFAALSQGRQNSPESGIDHALGQFLKQGDPHTLLALLGNGGLEGMSQEKQDLYRLNLLAAQIPARDGAGEPRYPGVVHLLYPEEMANSDSENALFHGAARALSAVNGGGGLDKQLLIVMPKTYAPGSLDSAIGALTAEPLPKGGQSILILDPMGETASLSAESRAQQPLLVLGSSDPGQGLNWLSSLPAGKESSILFPNASAKDAGKLLWAAGEPPAGKVEKVEFANTADSLNRLLARSAAEEATVVVEAARLKNLEGLNAEGRLLLLALGPDQLPPLNPKARAEALVLGSPLRTSSSSSLAPSPSSGLSPAEARLFDAVLLAAKVGDGAYSGITLNRAPDGKDQPASLIRYRWTPTGWVPSLPDR